MKLCESYKPHLSVYCYFQMGKSTVVAKSKNGNIYFNSNTMESQNSGSQCNEFPYLNGQNYEVKGLVIGYFHDISDM